jgi:intergrase/recombinase
LQIFFSVKTTFKEISPSKIMISLQDVREILSEEEARQIRQHIDIDKKGERLYFTSINGRRGGEMGLIDCRGL